MEHPNEAALAALCLLLAAPIAIAQRKDAKPPRARKARTSGKSRMPIVNTRPEVESAEALSAASAPTDK